MPDTRGLFSQATTTWFEESFEAPTPAQAGAWPAIARGDNTLVVAPTGSGKTLAAFLWSIDKIATDPAPPPKERLRVLYISPLKALAADIERNLRSPLAGIRNVAARTGSDVPDIEVSVRTGDTPQEDRRRFANHPPDILITTPESLFLLLTSRARDALRSVETVIIDEVHSVAATKRGAHLALSLERLDALLPVPARRVALSATVRPLEEVARFIGGGRDMTIVDPPSEKTFDLSVVVPVEDLGAIGEMLDEIPVGNSAAGDPKRKTIWPALEERLLELIRAHRSTIVFANSRRLAERLCARLNEMADEEIARAHHGSVSREQRVEIEEALKAGRIPAVVATSSLELGIDMGTVDLVIQVESPPSVASALQRIGRAGHQVGATSRGVIFPKWRGDLVTCGIVIERMKAGQIEAISYPRNPLDVLAQQIVAMVGMDDWKLDDLAETVRRAAPFATLPASALESVLDMLSGRYPSDGFAELRPRLNWDRSTGLLTGRPNAQRLAVTSGGTIPDRGLFGVFLAGEASTRVGELDEEMVYESRLGDVFVLGSSNWRIEEITHDRVLVTPAPGQVARMPFWKGDSLGRPIELGRALGAFMQELIAAEPSESLARLKRAGLDDWAAENLLRYLGEQKQATGELPGDRSIVIEKFRDELGDWRLCVHSPFGAQVHAPWALALQARLSEQLGSEVQTLHSDDGIVVRLPDTQDEPEISVFFEPEQIEAIVTDAVGGSALFASRFRECAARALLLPKRDPRRRSALWQQRQRSASLLQVASEFGSFPIILETMRECLQDVFDLPALVQLMTDVRSRTVRVTEVETASASPFASSLLFGYMGAFMYEGDAPLAERRAQALALDTALLAELLGRAELRDLIDPAALAEVELEAQRLAPAQRIRGIDEVHDALRILGDLTVEELAARGASSDHITELIASGRVLGVRVAGEDRLIAVEDASRFRDALGTALPLGVPDVFLERVEDPVADLVSRFARTHGPFDASDIAARLGLGVAVAEEAITRLERTGRVVRGEFRPEGSGPEWCDAEILRRLRRRSLAKLRHEAEAAPASALVRFLPQWQNVGTASSGGADALLRAIEQLQGVPLHAGALERLILPARVARYSPALLDQLLLSGEVTWAGAGPIGSRDGWVALYLTEYLPLLLPPPAELPDHSELHDLITETLGKSGALFFRQLSDVVGSMDDQRMVTALWDLVWAGIVTNDTFTPVRALVGGRTSVPARAPRRSSRLTSRGVGRPRMPLASGPPTSGGRWSLLPRDASEGASIAPTEKAAAYAEQLLDRYGVLTRGAVMSEHPAGGFAAVYQVLKAFEEKGRCRRGYFVEGLGAAQFAMPGAVDRMRAVAGDADRESPAILLAATDPANPFGAALPWPERPGAKQRPGRKAGAMVVIARGELAIYLERGGRTVLTFTADEAVLQPAFDALALAVRDGSVGRISVERADGGPVLDSPVAKAMSAAGFTATPKGLRLRA